MQRGSYSTHSISVFCIITDYEWCKWWWVKKKDGIGACYPFSHHRPFMSSANFKSQRVESSNLPVIASLFSIPGTGQVEKNTFCFDFRRIITVKDFKSKVLMQIHKLHSTSLFLFFSLRNFRMYCREIPLAQHTTLFHFICLLRQLLVNFTTALNHFILKNVARFRIVTHVS